MDSKRKTGFVGFLACLESVSNIFHQYVEQDMSLKYLLTDKFSQDHLELFFSTIRARGGFNNNPTTTQFKAAYKRLLVRHNARATGNCTIGDKTAILHAIHDSAQVTETWMALCRKYNILEEKPEPVEDDLEQIPDLNPLSEFKESAIAYIAGYVVRMVEKRTRHCKRCVDALTDQKGQNHPFVLFKDRGGLQKASESVVRVCLETEKCIENMLRTTQGQLPRSEKLPTVLSTAVLNNLSHLDLFSDIADHMFDTTIDDNHLHTLIQLVAKCYSKIKLHHLGKRLTDTATGPKVRKQLSKLILFKHQ